MKHKGIAIKRKDKERILLTETLPFELPIFFTNQKLYAFSKLDRSSAPRLVQALLSSGPRISYDFKIQRGDGRQRTLSIMHPASQLSFVDFYSNWDAYILNQCAKSTFSLRRPIQIGSVYYEPHLKDEDEQVDGNVGDLAPTTISEQRTFASTYFYYAQYNQIWKFFDSTEFRRIEQDFRCLRRLDISKCFQSIYTHSISWAVRSKVFAKKNLEGATFDSVFDQLMRNANWGETNGIIVGPEVSRLFAEVILQKIDANIRVALKRDEILPSGVAIHRYVDDYFLFFNSAQDADAAQRCIESCLDEYKLSLNESKTENLSSPLITNLSIARDSIKHLLRENLEVAFSWLKENEAVDAPEHLIQERSADILIRKLKSTIKSTGASYSTVAPYALGIVSKILNKASRGISDEVLEGQRQHDVYLSLSFMLEVAFFIYRMDMRVNTTYKISSILITAKNIADKFGNTGKIIRQEMIDHASSVLGQVHKAGIADCEIASLLCATFFVGGPDSIEPSELSKALNLDDESTSTNYFQIITALYCSRQHKQYERVNREACRRALMLLEEHAADSALRCEATLLFFDFIACPFVSKAHKTDAIRIVSEGLLKTSLDQSQANEVHNYVQQHLGACDWSVEELPALLRRKELKPAYD